jgi:hypothetical protein
MQHVSCRRRNAGEINKFYVVKELHQGIYLQDYTTRILDYTLTIMRMCKHKVHHKLYISVDLIYGSVVSA